MKNKDLDHIINTSFSSNDGFGIPSWDKMKDRLDQKEGIDILIGKSFENQKLDEIPDAWDEIENNLIINSTWPKIEAQLDRKKRRRGFFYWVTGSFLFAVLLFFVVEQYGNLYSEKKSKSTNSNVDRIKNIDIPSKFSISKKASADSSQHTNSTISQNKIVQSSSVKTKGEKSIQKFEKTSQHLEKFKVLVSSNHNPFEKATVVKDNSPEELEKKQIQLSDSKLSKVDYFKVNSIELITKPQSIRIRPQEEKASRKWTLGLFYEMNYDNIYDSKSRVAEQKGSLVDQEFSLGHSFGIYFTRKLKANFMIGGEFHFFDRLTKQFGQYENGKYVNHSLKLDYIRTNIMAGYRLPLKKRSFLEFHTGPFFAYLMSKKESHDEFTNEQQFDHQHYTKFNFGWSAKIGMSHDINRFNFAYGLGTNIGLINIYKGETAIQSKLNRTNTFEAGLYFRFGINL